MNIIIGGDDEDDEDDEANGFGSNNFREKMSQIEQNKTDDAALLTLASDAVAQMAEELKNMKDSVVEEFTPNFVTRFYSKKHFKVKVAASDE